MQHLDEGTIHAWLDGALPPLEAEQVAKHAAECTTCAAAVAEARGIIAGSARIVSALDDVPGGVIPGRTTRPSSGGGGAASVWRRLHLTPARAALAATVLLAVSTTLTLRFSSSPELKSDSAAITALTRAQERPAAPAPVARAVTLDSFKVPAPATKATAVRMANTVASPRPTQPVVPEERAVADAAARDTTTRVLAKTRVAAQEVAAGAAPAPPAALTASGARATTSPATALDQQADSASTFEGCYRLSADSSSGSTEMPSGLPTSFALTRPSPERRELAARRAFSLRADSIAAPPLVWRRLSTTEASVTFAGRAGGARPVSLLLTAGSPVAVASSGDRTTKVRVIRASCPR